MKHLQRDTGGTSKRLQSGPMLPDRFDRSGVHCWPVVAFCVLGYTAGGVPVFVFRGAGGTVIAKLNSFAVFSVKME